MKPSLAQIPKIIEFFGYDPFEKKSENLSDKMKAYRQAHRQYQKALAKMSNVNPSTLAGWENRKRRPSKKLLEKIYPLIVSIDRRE
jgi:DNA-binding XRE family transcriptional regulator